MVKNKWVAAEADERLAEEMALKTGVSKSITRILISRGIDTEKKISEFLNPDIKNLNNPFLLKDMDKAVIRIENAIENNEKIAVYGDYDVDGITGVTILLMYLKSKNADVFFYIPDRLKDGYGLNFDSMREIKEKKCGFNNNR